MKLVNLYKQLLKEAGESPGEIELRKVPLETAVQYCRSQGIDVPNLERNLLLAKKLFEKGKTKRADMPVIDEKDVRDFQAKLKNGFIDLVDPFSDRTDPSDPFPQGLSGREATNFMSNGLRDKLKPDDITKVYQKQIAYKDLVPIQAQVYLDKSVKSMAKSGVEGTLRFLDGTTLICSSDNRILDGHHRFLSGLILDPNRKVNCLVVDLPIETLLPLTIAYGDAVGNERNM